MYALKQRKFSIINSDKRKKSEQFNEFKNENMDERRKSVWKRNIVLGRKKEPENSVKRRAWLTNERVNQRTLRSKRAQ
jgi:hypothetical protein